MLYTGTKTPRPGSHAFLNTLHREIIMKTAIAIQSITRIIASHQKIAQKMVSIPIIASGLMFPVSRASSSSKEKFISFDKINKKTISM